MTAPPHAWIADTLEGPRSYIVVSILLACASIVANAVGFYWANLGLWLGVVMLLAVPLVLNVWYRADPVVRQKLPLLERARTQQGVFEAVENRVKALKQNRTEIDETFLSEKARVERELADLPNARLRALEAARSTAQINVRGPLQTQLNATHTDELADLSNLLQTLQREHMSQAVNTPIKNAHIEGVGHAMQERLVLAGISTAYDVTPDRVSMVPGFGPQRVAAVMAWRQAIEYQAKTTMPRSVTPAQQQAVRDGYEATRQSLQKSLENAEEDLLNNIAEIDTWYAHRPDVLRDQLHEAELVRQSEIRQVEVQFRPAHDAFLKEQTKQEEIARDVQGYRDVTYWNYVRVILLGRKYLRRRAIANLAACDDLISQLDGNIDFNLLPTDSPPHIAYAEALSLRERSVQMLESGEYAFGPAIAAHTLLNAQHEFELLLSALPSLSVPATPAVDRAAGSRMES